jgi:hypothetical protein
MNTRLLIGCAVALVMAACVSGRSDDESTSTTDPAVAWLLVAEPQGPDPTTSDTFMGAELEGTLDIDETAHCVWIDSDTRRYIPIFPPGTSLELMPLRVVMPNGDTLGDGDLVAVGGGGLGIDDVVRIDFLAHLNLDDECLGDPSSFWLMSPDAVVLKTRLGPRD